MRDRKMEAVVDTSERVFRMLLSALVLAAGFYATDLICTYFGI